MKKRKNENFMFLINSFIKHRFKSRGLRSVHSPYLYNLYYSLLHPKALDINSIEKIKSLDRKLRQDKQILLFNEVGSRSGHIKSKVSEVYKRTTSPLKDVIRLSELASQFDGNNILEMGTAFGTTSLAMSFAAKKSKIFTLEGVPEIAAIAKENFKRLKVDNIILTEGLFYDTLPEIKKNEKDFGLVFIDGHHSYKPTIDYLEMTLPILCEKAIVVLDDIYYSREMLKCWNELQSHPAFKVKIDFFHFGILVKNNDLSEQCYKLRL